MSRNHCWKPFLCHVGLWISPLLRTSRTLSGTTRASYLNLCSFLLLKPDCWFDHVNCISLGFGIAGGLGVWKPGTELVLLGRLFCTRVLPGFEKSCLSRKRPNNFLRYLNNTRMPTERVIAYRVLPPPLCSRLILTLPEGAGGAVRCFCGRITLTDE